MPTDPLVSLILFSGVLILAILVIIVWNLIEGKTSGKAALKDFLSFIHSYIFYLIAIAVVAIVFTTLMRFF